MAGLWNDVRYALRQLGKSPGFAITAVLMLALGICANSTVFSWINATLLDPIHGAHRPGELVSVMRGQWNSAPAPPLSYPDYRDLRDQNKSFSGLLAYHHEWFTLTSGDRPERIYVANTSGNYFDVLGVQPILGRFFRVDEEARPGGVPFAVLSYTLWQTRFGSDPQIVGKPIEIARHRLTIIGVAPEGFIGAMPGLRTDVWVPLAANTDPGSNDYVFERDRTWLNVIGRLGPGVTRANAQLDLENIMRRIVAQYPGDHLGVNTITLDPMWRSPFGANVYLSASLPFLLAIAGAVLLLTCTNVATLALVRFVSSRRELAVRQSLGAGRWQLMRQMMLESGLTALAGGGIAVLLTFWSAKTLARFVPPNASPILLNGYVDGHVIAVIVALTVAASAFCGALPAWRSSRVTAAEVLKEEAASVTAGGHNRRLLSGLVVGQVALSLALLVTAGLFLRTLRAATEADLGFEHAHVLTASVGLQISGFSDDEIRAFQHKALDQLRTLPGVEAASITDWLPMNFNRKTTDAYPEGYVPQAHESLEVRRADVSVGYFDTLRIPLVRGRTFTNDDNENSPRVVILDEAAAAHFWPGENPIGRRLRAGGRLRTVVGVVRQSAHRLVSDGPEPMIYLPIFQWLDPETILQVRTSGDPNTVAALVEQMVQGMNSRLPIYDVRSLSETTQMAFMFQRMQAMFATIFGLLALVLATTGIYGVVAYRTELRTHEIGIRVALGAARGDVLRLVLGQGMRLIAVGLVVGLVLAFLLARFLRGLLYGVSATDPWTALAVTALLAGIALVACLLPARRALHVDPVKAIRTQ